LASACGGGGSMIYNGMPVLSGLVGEALPTENASLFKKELRMEHV